MYQNNKLAIAVQIALSLGLVSQAQAQETKTDDKVERIEVTGSKIKRIGELSPTPVTVITGDSIVDAGVTNVGELLNDMPNAVTGLSPETTKTPFSLQA